ncbi:MAG: PfkB family carbohydrate kinase, partial [Planctomycetota bacterium]
AKVSSIAIKALRDGFKHEANIFYDINVRPPFFDSQGLDEFLPATASLKCNQDELSLITGDSAIDTAEDVKKLARGLLGCYVELKHLLVTMGARGAWWFGQNPSDQVWVNAPSPSVMADPVGAGDAFASVILATSLTCPDPDQLDIADMLTRAVTFASRVCELPGATTDDPSFYADVLPPNAVLS